MKKNGECIYACDYAGWPKQDWGYYTHKENDIYMIVFNLPYSKQLTVKTTKNVQITEAALLNGQQTKLIEVACNEYNISIPKTPPTEPFVIKLKIKTSEGSANKYKDALT